MKNRPFVIGHRGAMGYAPENTLASFEMGWKMGVDFLECDVHLSRDKQLVVMHDEALDRTTNGTGLIQNRSWPYIRKLEAGAWFHKRFQGQRPLRLSDCLTWLAHKKTPAANPLKLIVEIKNQSVRYGGIAESVVKALKQKGFIERSVVISYDHVLVRRLKNLCRDLTTGILFRAPLPDLSERIKWTQTDGLFPRLNVLTRSLMGLAHKKKKFVFTWTVNETKDMKKSLHLGVDGITTNYPDKLVKVICGRRGGSLCPPVQKEK